MIRAFSAMPAKLFPTPDDAESAFYEAFERADLAAMMAVWDEADDVVCVHPAGPRLVGFDAVRDSWVRIFSAGARLRIETTGQHRHDGQTVAVRTLVESVTPASGEGRTTLVCATNVYELTAGGWRMVAHHASALAPAVEEAPAPTLH